MIVNSQFGDWKNIHIEDKTSEKTEN